jgi:hypothetical protein
MDVFREIVIQNAQIKTKSKLYVFQRKKDDIQSKKDERERERERKRERERERERPMAVELMTGFLFCFLRRL